MTETTTTTKTSESDTRTVTVRVWSRSRYEGMDGIVEDTEPTEYELPVADPDYGLVNALTDDERVILAEAPENHKAYAFDVVDHDSSVTLNVYGNDSVHSPEQWGDPIERGLIFNPDDDYPPFKCEMWGRIMMWVGNSEK